MQAPISVRPNEIWQLGRHRLMCGDATDKEAVANLFGGRKPTLVVTSPPYAKQRSYDRSIACWDSMMMGALDGHSYSEDVQILVNLGVVHSKGEWQPYWLEWLAGMRREKWRVFAQYVWAKPMPMPGAFGARLPPAHEFVFHLNRLLCEANRWVPCRQSRKSTTKYSTRNRDGVLLGRSNENPTHSHKPPSSVLSVAQVRFGEATGHPAQMPVLLAQFLIRSWKKQKGIIYDPFCGSGTTLLACEQEGVEGLGMEISPAYCQTAIERWNKMYPDKAARLLSQ